MPRFDAPSAVKGELGLRGLHLRLDGVEQEPHVVAERELLEHPPREPVATLGEDRCAERPGAPIAAGELVDLVAGLPAEELGQRGGRGGNEVHRKALGLARHAEGAVVAGDADEEARRVDAALRGEADQAPRSAPPPGPGVHAVAMNIG